MVRGHRTTGRAVPRLGGRRGDHIFVTGSLGGPAAGLRLLERGAHLRKNPARSTHNQVAEELILRQLRPEPRVPWGALLGEEHLATAMIDISDGLSSDLAHLCHESRTDAIID